MWVNYFYYHPLGEQLGISYMVYYILGWVAFLIDFGLAMSLVLFNRNKLVGLAGRLKNRFTMNGTLRERLCYTVLVLLLYLFCSIHWITYSHLENLNRVPKLLWWLR
jgi:hypothetical protein